MKARCWKRLTWAVSVLQIFSALTFVVMVGATPEEWRAARPFAIATAVLAWLALAAGEGYRAALKREPWLPPIYPPPPPHHWNCRCKLWPLKGPR